MNILENVMTPTDHPKNLSWIIFGEPKVGKTTLACDFPSPLLIDIEGGTSFLQVPQFPLKKMVGEGKDARKVLAELFTELSTNPEHGFETIILDTADELWEMLARPHKKNGKLPIGEYQGLYETFEGIIEKFKSLGMDVVMTSHLKHDSDEDGVISSTDIQLPGKLASKVSGKVDEILYLTVKRVKLNEQDEDSPENTRQARYLVCQPMHHPKLGLIKAGDRSAQLPPYIVDPTFEKLSVAKTFKPGLFDGKGDVQDNPKEEKVTEKANGKAKKEA